MIGKPEWFTYRILGWGLRPKTWQGWVYMLVFVALVGVVMILPINQEYKQYITLALIAVLIIDVVLIMFQLDKVHDERERLHQLIIERAASYGAIAALAGVAVYQSMNYTGTGLGFDISIAIVLGVMLVAKVVTSLYVKLRM